MSDFNVSLRESGGEFSVKFRTDPGLPASVTPLKVTENGTYNAGEDAAYNPVTVAVPNSYSAADEGKVVSGGELVDQTALTVTENGPVDTTTTINSVTVDVPAPVIVPLVTAQNGTYTAPGGYNPVTVNVRQGIPIDVTMHINPQTGEWERPADWPDLDALAEQITGDQDCVYLTYDLRKTPGYGWVGYYAATADRSDWTMERGHVANGAFVTDETFNTASGGYFRQALDATNGNVQLWRIRATGHITTCGFATNSSVNSENFQNDMQPCVERAGTLPWCSQFGSAHGLGSTHTCGGTIWIEHDSIIFGNLVKVVGLGNCWQNCYSLQSLDLSGWDTTNWAVTNLGSCWQNCYSLQSLDLSGWDTTNWAVTNLSYCWHSCYSLQSLDLSGWDTTNWAVTNLGSCWYSCYSLQSLDLSGWDTTNWAVTNLSYCWYSCYSLQSLDLSGWDTTNWAVTNLGSCWYSCYSLQSLDLSGWDTTNWAVTNLSYCWYSCYSLIRLTGTESWTWVESLSSNTSNPNNGTLRDFDGIPLSVNHSYNQALWLTPESLIKILQTLPTVSATRTITLGQINKLKLTIEQIAIATQKGWTVT